jgi:hypothetical protein
MIEEDDDSDNEDFQEKVSLTNVCRFISELAEDIETAATNKDMEGSMMPGELEKVLAKLKKSEGSLREIREILRV